ncbi:hypothetical protein FRB98_007402 [Tulasnella sp. 332]|nr:hypothetical protein FRB98_007402 [Tulasnella sp. 332]
MRLGDLTAKAVLAIASLSRVLSAPTPGFLNVASAQVQRKLIHHDERRDLSEDRHELLSRIRFELIMRNADTQNWIMIEAYEGLYAPRGGWKASKILPNVEENVKMREDIDHWWEGKGDFDVRTKWLVWVMTNAAAERFPIGLGEAGSELTMLPPDLMRIPGLLLLGMTSERRDKFILSLMLIMLDSDKCKRRLPDPVKLICQTPSDQRQAIFQAHEHIKTEVTRFFISRFQPFYLDAWKIRPQQATRLSKLIIGITTPNMKLPSRPPVAQASKVPMLEDQWYKKWDSLTWEDKLIVRESVLVMTLRWHDFKPNVIDEPIGYLDV